jgi:hypothetical protein
MPPIVTRGPAFTRPMRISRRVAQRTALCITASDPCEMQKWVIRVTMGAPAHVRYYPQSDRKSDITEPRGQATAPPPGPVGSDVNLLRYG